jgi:hypothetical protein
VITGDHEGGCFGGDQNDPPPIPDIPTPGPPHDGGGGPACKQQADIFAGGVVVDLTTKGGTTATLPDGRTVELLKDGVLIERPTDKDVDVQGGKLTDRATGHLLMNVVAVLIDDARMPDGHVIWDLWHGSFYDRIDGHEWTLHDDKIVDTKTGVVVKLIRPRLLTVWYDRNWTGELYEQDTSVNTWKRAKTDRFQPGRRYMTQLTEATPYGVAPDGDDGDDGCENCLDCALIDAAGKAKSKKFALDCKNNWAPQHAAMMCNDVGAEVNGGTIGMKNECWYKNIATGIWTEFPYDGYIVSGCPFRVGFQGAFQNSYRDFSGCRDRWVNGMPGTTDNHVYNINVPASIGGYGYEHALTYNAYEGLKTTCAQGAAEISLTAFKEAADCRRRNGCAGGH